MLWRAFCITVLLGSFESSAQLYPKAVVQFPITYPGFITLLPNISDGSRSSWDIIISRFNGFPFSTDYVSIVRDIGQAMTEGHSVNPVEEITSELHWPNEAKYIPELVFNRTNMLVVPSGFLVPTKGQGALTIFDLNSVNAGTPYQLTSSSGGSWFYHRAVWLDMDGDGLLDLLTCRADKPIFGDEKGEMVWFKHPAGAQAWTKEWEMTTLASGAGAPDTFLIPVYLENRQYIITAGFFSKSVDIWWRKDEGKTWTSDNINKRVLDNTEGSAFDVVYQEVGDARELLVSYNKPSNGTLFVYQLDSADLRSSKAMKQILLSRLDPGKSGVGKGAPGGIQLVRGELSNMTGRPDIILSGDDDGKLFLLRPVDKQGRKYNVTVLLDSSPGTLGAICAGDIDNDGYAEIIAPSYDDKKITILTYNPTAKTYANAKVTTTSSSSGTHKTLMDHIHDWFNALRG